MAQMIPAFRVKAAVLPAVQKQIAAFGLSNKKFAVTFSGTGAYTSFKRFYDVESMSDYLTGFINYPAINDGSVISRPEADIIAAYSLHELGHVFFTKRSDKRNAIASKPILQKIWNGLEDPRIEAAMVNAKIGGARRAFRLLLTKLLTDANLKQFNPCNINQAPFALALMGRAVLGNSCEFSAGMLARIPEPKRSIYAAALNALKDAPLDLSGTDIVIDIAEKFLADWEKVSVVIRLPDMPDIPINVGPSEDEDKSDDGEDYDDVPEIVPPSGGESGEDEDDDEEGESDEDDESGEYGDSGESDEDDESGESGESDEFDESDEEFKLDSDDEPEVEFDDSGSDVDGGEMGMDIGDDDGAEIQAGKGAGGEEFKDDESEYSAQDMKSPEVDMSDMADRINGRDRADINLPQCPRARYSDVGTWDWKELTDRGLKTAVKRLADIKMGALKAQLVRLFRAPEVCGWDGGMLSGRFDRKKISRLLSGSEAVFKKRWETSGVDTAVTVVIDQSGSMNGLPIKMAAQVAYAIADAAESARAKVQVVGFRDGRHSTEAYGMSDTGSGYRYAPFDIVDSASLPIYKKYNEPLAVAGYKMARISKIVGGGTPDYVSLKTIAEDMAMRPESRRVILVLTDGVGDREPVNKLCAFAEEKLGIDIVGIGIGFSDAKYFGSVYPVGAVAPSLEDLVGVTLNRINKVLDKRLAGRRTM